MQLCEDLASPVHLYQALLLQPTAKHVLMLLDMLSQIISATNAFLSMESLSPPLLLLEIALVLPHQRFGRLLWEAVLAGNMFQLE